MQPNLSNEWIKDTIKSLDTFVKSVQGIGKVSCAPELHMMYFEGLGHGVPETAITELKKAWYEADGSLVTIDQLVKASAQLKELYIEPTIASVDEDGDEELVEAMLDQVLEEPSEPENEDEFWTEDEGRQDDKEDFDEEPKPRRRISDRAVLWGLGALSILVLLGGGSYCVANPDGKLVTMWSAHQEKKLAAQPIAPFPCGSTGQFTSKDVTYQVIGGHANPFPDDDQCVWLPTPEQYIYVDRGCLPGLQSAYDCPEVIRTFACGSEGQFASRGVTYQVEGGTSDQHGTCVLLETGVAIDFNCLPGRESDLECPAVKPVH